MARKIKKSPKPRDPGWWRLNALKPKVKPNKKKYSRKKNTAEGWGSTSIDME